MIHPDCREHCPWFAEMSGDRVAAETLRLQRDLTADEVRQVGDCLAREYFCTNGPIRIQGSISDQSMVRKLFGVTEPSYACQRALNATPYGDAEPADPGANENETD